MCLDTCHVSDARGTTSRTTDGVLTEFDRGISLEGLKAVHINDSLRPAGLHKDRHARIGGAVWARAEALGRVVRHHHAERAALLCWGANRLAGYAREIALLKGCAAYDAADIGSGHRGRHRHPDCTKRAWRPVCIRAGFSCTTT